MKMTLREIHDTAGEWEAFCIEKEIPSDWQEAGYEDVDFVMSIYEAYSYGIVELSSDKIQEDYYNEMKEIYKEVL